MANDTKTRGTQLIKTERDELGIVRFFDRRDGKFIGSVDVTRLEEKALHRAALHGITQNILDSSNKLDGDERVAFIRDACEVSQSGGWASAPSSIDPEKAREAAIKAFMAMGLTRDAAIAAVDQALG